MPAVGSHAVEDVAGEPSLNDLRIPITRMQAIAKDPLVAHERVLGAGLLVIARFLLPLASTNPANASNCTISRSTSATSSLRGLDWRHDDLRASTQSYIVQRATTVGRQELPTGRVAGA